MSDLVDAVDSVKYLVSRPGTFESFYPETTEDMLVRVLVDGMAECQLMGTLLDYSIEEDGTASPDLAPGQVSMVVLFAAVRFIRAELLNRNTQVVYEAGSAHYETTQATNILRDILKALQAQKDAVINALLAGGGGGAGAAFFMADQYLARIWDSQHRAGPVAVIGW